MCNSLQNDPGSRRPPSYQNVTLPEPVYDYVYDGRPPIPLALRDVKGFVQQMDEQIGKFEEQYKVCYLHTINPSQTQTTFLFLFYLTRTRI